MNELEQVVLGALVHDAGKLFERAELLGEYRTDPDQQQADCRWQEKGGYYSHRHVLHTRRFCELLAERVPALRPETGQRSAGADQHWMTLAARHHVASTPLERLVSAADHLASAEREEGSVYEKRIHQRTFLEPVLERVTLGGERRPTLHRQPLAELLPEGEGVFPKPVGDFQPPLRDEGGAWLSPESLVAEYRQLAEGLLAQLERLPQPATASPNAVRSLVRTLLAVFERFLVNVPSATNVAHPDVSLFDHMRVTAAIAEGLYRHHESRGTLAAAGAEDPADTDRWRLVCGDLSGIQGFIYRLTSKGAAKGLRGRSLFVQLLCDGVSDFLLRRLGLFPTARIYSSGGKFYLLVADCLEGPLRDAAAEVNAWLLREFGGDLSLGIGVAEVRTSHFRESRMGACWQAANEDLLRDRLRRFGAAIEEDPQGFFDPAPVHPDGACQVCGRDDAESTLRTEETRKTCARCRDLERLGQSLAKARLFFWAWGDDRETARRRLGGETHLSLEGLGCDLYVLDRAPEFGAADRLDNSLAEWLGTTDCCRAALQGHACGFRLLGRWDPAKESGRWEFDDFAEKARGVDRLGVLRLDVDNLGQIFIRGLRFPSAGGRSEEMASLSRVATLSRQLGLFFSGHLGRLLADFPRTQIIYSGGDDLFLLGSWDELPEVAWAIRREFSRYCAGNPAFTLSGGLALVGGKYPIARAAEQAGEAEHTAKAVRWQGGEKDAVSLIETPIPWRDYPAAVALRDRIMGIAGQPGGKALIGRLRSVILAQQEFQRRELEKGNLSLDRIRELAHWQRWRWQLAYNLKRLAGRRKEWAADLDAIQEAILSSRVNGHETALPVLEWLQLPTRWAEFLTRKEDRK